MKKKYFCPVCGFNGLKEPPYGKQGEPSYEVCPCCGYEFGFDQSDYAEFRKLWIDSGAKWFMQELKPRNWSLNRQLKGPSGGEF